MGNHRSRLTMALEKSAFAPGTTMIEFSPALSMQILATPVVAFGRVITSSTFTPIVFRVEYISFPFESSPIVDTKCISEEFLHNLATATAWFAPFPPQRVENVFPMIVSPRFSFGFANSIPTSNRNSTCCSD